MANDNSLIQRRMSQKSTLSANSDGMRSGHSSRRGSAYTGDSENCTTVPAITKDSEISISGPWSTIAVKHNEV